MDRLKTEWDKGVSKMKTLGQERKEEETTSRRAPPTFLERICYN